MASSLIIDRRWSKSSDDVLLSISSRISAAFCSSPNCSKALAFLYLNLIMSSAAGDALSKESANFKTASGEKVFSGMATFLSVDRKRSIISWLGSGLCLQETIKNASIKNNDTVLLYFIQ